MLPRPGEGVSTLQVLLDEAWTEVNVDLYQRRVTNGRPVRVRRLLFFLPVGFAFELSRLMNTLTGKAKSYFKSPVTRLIGTWSAPTHVEKKEDNCRSCHARHPVIRPVLPAGRVYNPVKEPASIPALEVKTIEQKYVSPAGWRNFSHCGGRSRPAAGLQMGGDCRRLAGSDVGKCGRPCHSDLSCVCRPSETIPGKLVPHRATVLVDHDREA